MKISGVATVYAPAAQVWTALTDPAVLSATIPGCERLDPAGSGSYRFAAQVKIASIEGSYTGQVSISQQQEASSLVLTVNGAGAPGAVSGSVQVRLAETADGSTELSYDADAVFGGLIAAVGQRMLCSAARRIADEFVSSVDEILAGGARAATAMTPAAAPVPDAQLRTAPVPVADTQVPAAFARGVLVGTAGALAGVALAGLIGRRAR